MADLQRSDAFVSTAALEVDDPPAQPVTGHSATWWVAACLTAILLGVIPALLINHWRNRPEPAPVVAPRAVVTAPPPTTPPPQPAVATGGSDAPIPTVPMIEIDEDTTTPVHTDRVRHPPAHPPATKRTPVCDVYLHPHGCPH